MKKTNETIRILQIIVVILSFLLSLYSVYLFGNAVHNIDLGQNIEHLNAEYNLSLGDLNSNYEMWTGKEMYIDGQNQLREALFLFGFSIFIFGYSLRSVIE